MREWLGHLIMYSMTSTLSGLYVDYFTLGQGLLGMVADIHGITVSDKDISSIAEGMKTMPAHPDVVKGLELLRDNGLQLDYPDQLPTQRRRAKPTRARRSRRPH